MTKTMKHTGYRRLLLVSILAATHSSLLAREAAGAPDGDEQRMEQPEDQAPAAPPEQESAAPPTATQGVSPEQKELARVHYVTGNELLRTASFEEAVAAYQRALAGWQHPRIYYNLAIALLNLDRPVDAYDAISAAIASEEPLGAALQEQAINYQKLLRRQIGEIEVRCAEAGTRVTMNGKELFLGPGSFRSRVRVGRYQLVASKPGFLSAESAVAVLPDKQVSAEIAMRSQDDAVITKRRIERTWVPWAVVGLGGAAAVAGGAMHYQAYVMFDDADTKFEKACPLGCSDGDPMAHSSVKRMNTAGWLQRFAFGSYVAGSAAVVAGLTLAYLNQPQVTYLERSDIRTDMHVAPMLSSDAIGLQGSWSY